MKLNLFTFLLFVLTACSNSGSNAPNTSNNNDFNQKNYEKIDEKSLKSELGLFLDVDQINLLITRTVRLQGPNQFLLFKYNDNIHLPNSFIPDFKCTLYMSKYRGDNDVVMNENDRFSFKTAQNSKWYSTPDSPIQTYGTIVNGDYYQASQPTIAVPASINCDSVRIKNSSNEMYITFDEFIYGINDYALVLKIK